MSWRMRASMLRKELGNLFEDHDKRNKHQGHRHKGQKNCDDQEKSVSQTERNTSHQAAWGFPDPIRCG